MKQKIWRVKLKVKPSPQHPLYFEWEDGWLNVWLLDESFESAAHRATDILEHLPYEIIGDTVGVSADEMPGPEKADEMRICEHQAKRLGFAMYLWAVDPFKDTPQS
jgi:hypothetical protein